MEELAIKRRELKSEVPTASSGPAPDRLTLIQWVVCAVACVGFAFDLYEHLMLPLILRPSLMSLGNLKPGSPGFNLWVGLLFYVPNFAGGVFGLLGGYLSDLFGRRQVLLWSILLYSASACAASFSTSLPQLLLLRSTTLIGACVEFVAAIAWLAELFPCARQRESILGNTQAFQAVGGMMVTAAYYLAVTFGERLPLIRGGHEAWRYTLLSGLIPAVPLLVVRPFLPESPLWKERRKMGGIRRPHLRELLSPILKKTTVIATLLFACTAALPYGAVQHTVRMIPGLAEVRNLTPRHLEQAASGAQFCGELGALAGRIVFTLLIIRIVSQRSRMRVFLIPGLIIFPWLYFYAATRSLTLVYAGMFLAVMVFNGLHSFWGNYLPRMYPTRLRGTGESFAANIGGRVIGVSAALVTTNLANMSLGGNGYTRLAYSAGIVSLSVLVLALVVCAFLPEPEGGQIPD